MYFKLVCFVVFAFGLLTSGCGKQARAIVWSPNLGHLEDSEKKHPELAGLSNDVKKFYESIRDKNWRETYEYRNSAFQKLVPLETYLRNVPSQSSSWKLLNYEILNIEIEADSKKVVAICRFIQSSLVTESYKNITWIKEGNRWRCDAAGPIGVPVFEKLVD